MFDDQPVVGNCVKCGLVAGPLYRRYGKHALRLTQCNTCGSIADKYIEYDPFIIIIDLVLLSKEAHRHILYNTEFKAFWRLFLILIAMETYIDWSNSYLTENREYLNTKNDSEKISPLVFSDSFPNNMDEEILFEFGGLFICCLLATLSFIGIIFLFFIYFGLSSFVKKNVDYLLIWKAFTLANIGKLLMLPVLIWGSDHDRPIHSILVFIYITLALVNVQSVIFECSKSKAFLIIFMSYIIKLAVSSYLYLAGVSLYKIFH